MPLPSSETRFMPSLCRGINPINSSISVKSNACISQGQSHEGILNQRRDLYIKDSYVFFFNSIRRDGNEPWFYLERGCFERLKIYPGHEAYSKEVNIFWMYFSINTKPTWLHELLRLGHGTWWSTAYRSRSWFEKFWFQNSARKLGVLTEVSPATYQDNIST
jgi:hypothetical protein